MKLKVWPSPDSSPPKVGEPFWIKRGETTLVDTEIGAIPIWEPPPEGTPDEEWTVEEIEKFADHFIVHLFYCEPPRPGEYGAPRITK